VSFSEQLDPDWATICGGSFLDVQKYNRNDRYGQERTEWTEMDRNGQKWTEMDKNRQKWTKIDRNGPK